MDNKDPRYCRECGDRIHGRSDKVFCSDYCRSIAYQNNNAESIKRIRNINYILKRNRAILTRLYKEGVRNTSRTALAEAGLNLRYCTHHIHNDGSTQWFCYDSGFENAERDEVRIFRTDEDDITSQDFC